MYESHKKIFWFVVIVNLIYLAPRSAFATEIGMFHGVSLFLYPIFIPVFNLVKIFIIRQITPQTQEIDKHFVKTLLGVTLVEIFLIFLCYIIVLIVIDVMYYPDRFDSDVTEMFWVFIVSICYWMSSIIPNYYLVNKINIQFIKTAVVSKKIIYASMLALILPGTLILLLFLGNFPLFLEN